MEPLFTRPNGMPLRFHLCDFENLEKYKNLVQNNGGKVEHEPQKNVLTFTTPEFCFKYKFVFNVKYITDCVNAQMILNVNNYYIGDSRFAPICRMAKFCTEQDSCYEVPFLEIKRLSERHNMEENNKDEDFDSSKEEVNNISDDEIQQTEVSSKQRTKSSSSESSDISENLTEKLSKATLRDESSKSIVNQISDTESNTDFFPSDESSNEDYSHFRPQQFSEKLTSQRSQRSPKHVQYSKVPIDVSHENASSTDEMQESRSESEELSQDLLAWRDSVVKNKKKDEDGFPIRSFCNGEESDKKLILDFIIKSRKIFTSKSFLVYELARNLKFLPKQITAESMRWTYKNNILPKIEDFDLPKKIEEKFINYRTFGRAALKFPVYDLFNWAKTETKDLEKDENGYPNGDQTLFKKWEKYMIIKFFIKIGVDKVEDGLAWEFARNLKLFPIHRTKESLQCEFKFNILPEIESFNLSSQDKYKFINLRDNNPSFKTPSSDLIKWAEKATENLEKDNLGFPISKDRFIQDWEKQIMVNYLIYTKQIQQALMKNTWKYACSLKIFAKQRTFWSVVSVMRFNILPTIESFNLPKKEEDAFIKLRNSIRHNKNTNLTKKVMIWAEEISKTREKDKDGFPKSKTSTKKFERWEHELMIQFLIISNKIESCSKITTWKNAVTLKIFPKKRTFSILRAEFNGNVLPAIKSFELEEEILTKFLKCQTCPSITPTVYVDPPENLKKWAETVTKKRQLDNDGYPVLTAEPIQTWEKKLMLDFLIEAKKISEAKLFLTWQLCRSLKILPKKRIAYNMQRCFLNSILPKIKFFGLPASTVQEFLQIE